MTIENLVRVENWRARFDEECDRIRMSPFSWETNECAVGLAGNLTLALTGVDVAAPYRGRYKSKRGALRVLASSGFANLADAVASLLPEHAHPSMARVGDIAAIPDDAGFGYALGVVNGERIFVLMESGFGTVDRSLATRAFKVG